MAKTKTIPIETLLQLLNYNPETGEIIWKPRPIEMFSCERFQRRWNTRYAGKRALTAKSTGYFAGPILGKTFKLHRVIWAMHYGEWPDYIDHINHDRTDNRISNLRSVTLAENMKNQTVYKNNVSGVSGVYWSARDGVWMARISIGGIDKHLGTFRKKDDAIIARRQAEAKNGFHPNHGR